MGTVDGDDRRFWIPDLDKFHDLIEEEVYAAVKDIFTSDDPDIFFWFLHLPEEEEEEPLLWMVVPGAPGSDKFPELDRKISLSALVNGAIEGNEGSDGKVYLKAAERRRIEMFKKALENQAERVGQFLENALEYGEED